MLISSLAARSPQHIPSYDSSRRRCRAVPPRRDGGARRGVRANVVAPGSWTRRSAAATRGARSARGADPARPPGHGLEVAYMVIFLLSGEATTSRAAVHRDGGLGSRGPCEHGPGARSARTSAAVAACLSASSGRGLEPGPRSLLAALVPALRELEAHMSAGALALAVGRIGLNVCLSDP